jgi:NitT/TauT family transport system ATP-binding protein
MPDNLLVVERLTKRFDAPDGSCRTVIDNLSFSVQRGARVTVFAPSSAGKTTLINILAGLDAEYEGSFTLAAARPATIFQEPRLFPHMTVEENILLPARLKRVAVTKERRYADERARERTYEQWLEVCGLTPFAHHYPYQLSGGMKQKAAIIRGYLTEPDFVMMDEPFKSIDMASKQAIIRHILDQYPLVTVLFLTHAIEEVPLLTESLLLFRTNRLAEYRVHDVMGEHAGVDLMEAIYG